jgi:hypothetical protein
MCRRVRCSSCGMPGYAGCGQHVEQVLGDVPPGDRCRCREEKKSRARGQVSLLSSLKHLFGRYFMRA